MSSWWARSVTAETAQIAVQAALTGHLVLIDTAHQLRRRGGDPAAGHGGGGLSADSRSAWGYGAAAGAAAVPRVPARPNGHAPELVERFRLDQRAVR